MRPLAPVLLLLLSLQTSAQEPAPSPREPQQTRSGSNKSKQNSKTDKQPTAQSAPIGDSNPAPRANPQSTDVAGDDKQQTTINIGSIPRLSVDEVQDWTDRSIWIFNLLLVAVGGFQAWLLFKTLNATQKSADAAVLATNALIGSERAWLLLESIQLDNGITRTNTSVVLRFKNSGRTPATVTKAFYRLTVSEDTTSPAAEGELSVLPEITIGPQESTPEIRVVLDPNPYMTLQENKSYEAGTSFYRISGVLLYTDIFRSNRFTRFYLCKSMYAQFAQAGPAGANECT